MLRFPIQTNQIPSNIGQFRCDWHKVKFKHIPKSPDKAHSLNFLCC